MIVIFTVETHCHASLEIQMNIGMDLQTSKLELVKMIVNIDNQATITRLLDVLKSEKKDFWQELSNKDKQEIEAGIKQLDLGERVSWEEVHLLSGY